MQAWESDSDREMVARLIAESQRPAPTDGWRTFACAPEGGLREATPEDVQEIRRTLDEAYGEDDAHVTAALDHAADMAVGLIVVAFVFGGALGILIGFVMGRASL